MDATLIRWAEILTVVSNVALLLPFVGALYARRSTRAWIFFFETWVSLAYHLCGSFNACLFTYRVHHNLDFFFAQLLIFTTVLYLVDFHPEHAWIERGLIFLAAITIVILQATLSTEIYVQAAIGGVAFIGILIYWLTEGVPNYNWENFLLGISLICGSAMLYVLQDLWPNGYWAVHSVWHVGAGFGQYYWLGIKPRPRAFMAMDSRIPTRLAARSKFN